ncbi:MOSC domain-containing protein [Terriglobus sp.]|uniref:MOSC domain-containing protein n=1 Tax=Terriglobus sp. TaxID=1889013 RepID=UPI003B00E241
MLPLAYIAELWRYPVKSMRGEQVDALEVQPDGIAHDRRYAFLSSGAPAGKPRLTGRERAALLRYSASVSANGTEIRTPEGRRFQVHDPALLTYFEQHLPHGNRITLEHDPAAGPYTDVRPIAIVSTETLAILNRTFGRAVDPRRFRSNLLITFTSEANRELTGGNPDLFPEDAVAGHTLQLGATCRLRLLEKIPRCRVVTLDPDTVEPDPALMKHLDRRYGGRLGIYAAVVTSGPVQTGDAVAMASTEV